MDKFSIVGELIVVVKDLNNETNKSVLLAIIKATSACRVVVPDTTSALFWLNQGATKVILDFTTTLAEASLPKDRVVLSLSNPTDAEQRIGNLKEFASEFLVPFSADLSNHMETINKVFYIFFLLLVWYRENR